MNVKEKLAAAIKAAQKITQTAVDETRDLTETERAQLKSLDSEISGYKKEIDGAKEDEELMNRIKSYGNPKDEKARDRNNGKAKTLGEHFVKSVGEDGLAKVKTISDSVVSAPEFKASDDTLSTPGTLAPWLTEYDQTIVRAFRRPVVSDLLGQGTLSGNAITYLVEGSVDQGSFGELVGEGEKKNQFAFGDPETRTDSLKKIAGFLKFTDEMAEDVPFWVSEINERGIYLLALAEERALIRGISGFDGILRSGYQTETASGIEAAVEAVYRGATKIQTASGLEADGIVINPADYEQFRLNKDGNGQYYGGGYFTGPYGNGNGIEWQPPIWGLRTVVSPAVEAGKPIVGAFGTASTVYRKGGVRVESTNSHAEDFTSDLITTRIEERIALAVRVPTAFCQIEISDADSGGGDD